MDKITGNIIGEVEAFKSDEKFVRVPMKMFAYENPCSVTDDEIAVYCEIVYHVSARDVSISHVNVELLYARLQWDASTHSRGKNRIIDALEGLKAKGYISIDSNDKDIKATTYLTIHTPRKKSKLFDEKVICGNTTYTAWQGVTERMMKIARADVKNIGQRIKVLTYVMWRFKINYSICYDEWANVLKVSASTVKRIIKSLKEEGIIKVKSGVYYTDDNGNVRQEINQYSINDESEDEEDGYKPTHKQYFNKLVKVQELLVATTDSRMECRSELFEYGSSLSEEDMFIYLTSECPIVKEWGKNRFDLISKNIKGKAMVEAWESRARKKMEQPQSDNNLEIVEMETVIKENKSTVELSVREYAVDSGQYDYSTAFLRAQAKREEQERIKREEENERFRQEMLELDEDEAEAI